MEHASPEPLAPVPPAAGASGPRAATPRAGQKAKGGAKVREAALAPVYGGRGGWRLGASLGACAAVAALTLLVPPRPATAEPRVAVFDFELDNTSPAPSTPEELERTRRLGVQLREMLGAPGRYEVVDIAPVRDRIARVKSIRSCNGCELDAARHLGAELAAYGWVQKVSNLILNINVVIEDAETGRPLRADSVDIRGNTDESWQRGLRYLVNNRLFRAP